MRYDRDDVLAATDLGDLAEEYLGPATGRGSSAHWPCPDPAHDGQTGRTPPLSVFRSSSGTERWHCHSCGAGGTAADLVMASRGVSFAEALEILGRRAGSAPVDRSVPSRRRTVAARAVQPEPAAVAPEIEGHVAACEAYLATAGAAPIRRWLANRGLGGPVLAANRVGADPGPRTLPRPRGLPRGGPAVILPVLGPDGRAIYLQARYLHPPPGRKYDNPAAALVGPSPRIAEVRLLGPQADPTTVVVCEGLPDALIAAQAGRRSVAVLGAGLPDDRVAAGLVARFPTERLVVAFDADARGRAGSQCLVDLLVEGGAAQRTAALEVPVGGGDLNDWQLARRAYFAHELADAIGRALQDDSPSRASRVRPSAVGLTTGVSDDGRGHTERAPSSLDLDHRRQGREGGPEGQAVAIIAAAVSPQSGVGNLGREPTEEDGRRLLDDAERGAPRDTAVRAPLATARPLRRSSWLDIADPTRSVVDTGPGPPTVPIPTVELGIDR